MPATHPCDFDDEVTSVECPFGRRKVSGQYAIEKAEIERRARVREIERVLAEYLATESSP